MSKKINPHLFRKNFNFTRSKWVDKKDYKINILCIKLLDNIFKRFFNNQDFIFITNIHKIENAFNTYILIEIFLLFRHVYRKPKKLELKQQNFIKEYIKRKVKNIFKTSVNIKINYITKTSKNIFYNLINYLENQIKRNVKSKLIFNTFFDFVENNLLFHGYKIEMAGRLGGIEKAKTLFKTKGSLRLQSFNSKVVFLTKDVITKDGIVNVKFWICLV